MCADDHDKTDLRLIKRARDGNDTDQTLRCRDCGATFRR